MKQLLFLFLISLLSWTTIAQPCSTIFTYAQLSGSSFQFTGTATGPGAITNYVWNFGDGSPVSSIQSPTHTYAASGYYNVCLTVYGYDSMQNTFTCNYCDSVYVQSGSPSCNASFTMTNSGNTANFTNTSTASGTITNYFWTFGDGGTSTQANPTHAYTNSGYYNVCLNIVAVSSAGTTQCNFCDSIWVGSNPSPCAATFTYTQTSGSSFNFFGAGSGPGAITNYVWNFGDGSPASSLQSPSHTYTASGYYNVCLTVYGYDSLQNPFTCVYCDSVYAQSGGLSCNASFSMVNNGNTAYFTNTSTASGVISNYNWTFGDGGSSTIANPVHTYTNAGYYSVCLVISGTSSAGFFQCYFCDSVYVSNPCSASFTSTQTSGSSFNFTSTSVVSGTITNYLWDFGDGSPTSTSMNPSHTYTASGYYNVCLTLVIVDTNNTTFTCTFCDSVYAQSGTPLCNASFTMANTGNTAYFTNTSTVSGTITNYFWTFGDGGTSTQANPTHAYTNSGYYNVCLNIVAVSSAGTTQCNFCDSIWVGSNPSPCVATFTYSQMSGSSFNFFGAGSGPGAITNYVWNFGDGSPASSLQSPSHTYTASGYYNVCLTVYGYDSLQNPFTCVYCDSVYAQSGGPSCNASFSMVNNGNTAYFTNTSTASGVISNYNWTFGDGGSSTIANPVHTYTNAGYYSVCLVISGTSSAGFFQCYFCDSVYVSNPCSASFTSIQTSGSSFNFTSTSVVSGTITNYLWDFGDGSPTSTSMNPSHTYTASGYYNICLTLVIVDTNNTTFTCTFCDSVYAQSGTPLCNASFTMANTGNTAYFTNTSTVSGTITNYFWTFGDGGTSTQANPTHAYTNSGYYNVCLNIVAVSSAGTTQCNFCDSIWVGSNPSPCAATFTYTQTSGSSFNFISAASGPGTITNYAWTFGDGGTSTLANPTHNYTTSGIKVVCLTVTGFDSMQNMFSCTYCDSIYVQAGSGCIVNAGYSMSLNYLTANFTNTTTCPTCVNMNYAWTFGDGGTSSQQNPSHTYANSGSYNVCLVVTGYDPQNQTCIDSFCNIILVNPNTISSVDENQALEIYPNPTNGTLNLTLPFTGDTRIKITDMTGQIIWMKQVNVAVPQYMLHLESLSTGIYIIQIQHEDKLLRANFSKQ